jgi:hypothetical protein
MVKLDVGTVVCGLSPGLSMSRAAGGAGRPLGRLFVLGRLLSILYPVDLITEDLPRVIEALTAIPVPRL